MLIARKPSGPLERAVGDKMVETKLAKLLRAVLTCGCITYSDQVKGIGQISFHILITHSHSKQVVGEQTVETQWGKTLGCVCVCSQV